jgi:hypothetical protein
MLYCSHLGVFDRDGIIHDTTRSWLRISSLRPVNVDTHFGCSVHPLRHNHGEHPPLSTSQDCYIAKTIVTLPKLVSVTANIVATVEAVQRSFNVWTDNIPVKEAIAVVLGENDRQQAQG